MKTLQLDKQFNPVSDEDFIKYESFIFKGGEPHIKILDSFEHLKTHRNIMITHRIHNMNDLGLLLVAVEALKRMIPTTTQLYLILPYFPGARQDRVMVIGEPLTVKVYADIINSLELDCVIILDPHSEVTPALLNNVHVINNHEFVLECLKDLYPKPYEKTPLLISPDAGSNKKIKDLAKFLYGYQSNIEVVKCDKSRDVSTGNISGFEVYSDDLQGRDCIIVDDICDGGGTFIGLAQELEKKNCGELYLIVTHGIFSKGLKELCGYFDGIYCTDSFDPLKYHQGVVPKKFKQIKISYLL